MKKKKDPKERFNEFLDRSLGKDFRLSPKVVSVSCLQFGDTGKGKIVDLFAQWANIVVRCTGGDNAGHSVKYGEKEMIFHILPSAMAHEKVLNVIGNGCAVYPKTVDNEIQLAQLKGISCNNLRIALNAHLLLPHQIIFDTLGELKAGKNKIGSTNKGMMPVYKDFVGRRGLFVNDLLNPDMLKEGLRKEIDCANALLAAFDQEAVRTVMQHEHLESGLYYQKNPEAPINFNAVYNQYIAYGRQLQKYIVDTDKLLRESVGKKNILLEGAQGLLLSVKYGTYPFVTSSDCSLAGMADGAGIRERDIDVSFGIFKAYMTRVGRGPFPTEMGGEESDLWCNGGFANREIEEERFPKNDILKNINGDDSFKQGVAVRQVGGEYGATTKRPRRVGWLDLPLLNYALKNQGITHLIMTKGDILTGIKNIKICYRYSYDGPDYKHGELLLRRGTLLRKAIVTPAVLSHCTPFYEVFPGWKKSIRPIRELPKLPNNFWQIVKYIHARVGMPVSVISVGPERDENIYVKFL